MKALIFPGQGSQKTGMGLAMAESFSWASEMMHKADEILGRNISDICFNGPDEELKKTINTQPAIFVVSAANRMVEMALHLAGGSRSQP